MDSKTITAFVSSVQNVFETMLQMSVQIGAPSIKESNDCTHDVSGIIGMSGGVEGTAVLSLPINVSERIVAALIGDTIDHKHEDFSDAIGELINMIAGVAKAQIATDSQVNITCPSVIIGTNHGVYGKKGMVTIHIPCECDCGEFAVEVSLRSTSDNSQLEIPEQETATL